MDSKELRLIKEAYSNIYESYGEKEEKEEKGEKEKDCVPKSEKGEHNCAKKVCHEQFGEGTCIFGEHAEPDRNGFVSHYDVIFEHGIERGVPTSEMEILVSESHGGHGGKKKKTMVAHYEAEGEQLDEMVPALQEPVEKVLRKTSEFMKKNPVGRAIGNVIAPVGSGRGTARSVQGAKHMRDAGVGPSERPTGLNNSADLFDIVKGHLMSEGYADNEEAALAIMANMSEEWRQSIVEGIFDFLPKSTTVVPGKYGKNTVLARKSGVEGVADKSKPGSFTPQKGGWDSMDANRYADERIKQGSESGEVNLANRRVTPNRVK